MIRPPSLIPGLALTTVIAAVSVYVHALPFPPFTVGDRHPVDALIVAILIGVVVRNLIGLSPRAVPGTKYSVKSVLPFAIVLMGAKLDFFDVMRVSGQALLISITCVTLALVLTLWVCDRMGVGRKLALLIGVGTAICGGTAIAVSAPVIEADDNDTAFAVTTITVFGLLAIFLFPPLGAAMSMSQTDFGIWAGVAIQATPQVMAAGFSYGPTAGEVAVIVKLARVLLLAPIVVVLGAWYAREKRRQQQAHVAENPSLFTLFPPFVIGFILIAAANTAHLLPDFTLHLQDSFLWAAGDRRVSVAGLVTTASGFLITMAMAGVGLGVHVPSMRRVGLKPLYAGMTSAAMLAVFSVVMIRALA